jgi:uncharacterized protein
MCSLAECEKKLLFKVAREAIAAAVAGHEFSANPPDSERLRTPSGAFVTLRRGPRLRGCIGQIVGLEPLVEVIAYCARAAALDDPRFAPVRPDEVPELDIEISVLSPLEDITPDKIVAGKHGLVVTRGWERGVLLPQVATEFNWSAEKFLEETCVKAGLGPDDWKDPETRIQAFTAEVFGESELNPRSFPQRGYSIST